MLSPDEMSRYQRQIVLSEIGENGQLRLKNARVFIAGAGGLGSISACYLAAAGVGCIRIADYDRVEAGNLNRQILHGTSDIGKPKTVSAWETLHELNPLCEIQPIQGTIQHDGIDELVSGCQVIVDATDNLETRKVLNRVSVRKQIPFLFGGIEGFSGMTTTMIPGQTPCLECIFPRNGGPWEPVGVIGPVAGLIGSIQSLEAIKCMVGMKPSLAGDLLVVNGMEMTFRKIRLEKRPSCHVCQS